MTREHHIEASITRIKQKRIEYISIAILIIVSAGIYSFTNWQKHSHFQTFGWDTAVFDQQVYLFSQGEIPYSSLHASLYNLPKVHSLADHFHPFVLLIGGVFYKIWADPRMLFILQSVIVAFSGIPLYFTSQFLLRKLPLPALGVKAVSFSMMTLYLFSISVQAMTLDEFHDDVLVTLPLLFALYFILIRNIRWYWISYIMTLLTKEEYGLLGFPLGLYLAFHTRKIKHSLATVCVGIGVFYFLLFFLMPYLANTKDYAHFRTENRPSSIAIQLLSHPISLITKFVDHPKKVETLFISLASYGFLPLFSGPTLLLPFFALAIRFYDPTTIRRYEFNNHYASPAVALFAFTSVIGLYHILNYPLRKKLLSPRIVSVLTVAFLFGITVMQDGVFHGPINSLLKKSFYETQSWERDAIELIQQVPPYVPIAANNSLLPHVSQRQHFYLLPEISDAQFIAVDLHNGPNKFSSYSAQFMTSFINDLVLTNRFEVAWQKNEALLLQRK